MGRILAVDDDADMLSLLRAALERDGHFVDVEREAGRLTAEKCRLYDLLLLDVMMPGEDGFSACAASWIAPYSF